MRTIEWILSICVFIWILILCERIPIFIGYGTIILILLLIFIHKINGG